MSSGTKVALVALLVILVAVIARAVKDSSEPSDSTVDARSSEETAKTTAANIAADKRSVQRQGEKKPAVKSTSRDTGRRPVSGNRTVSGNRGPARPPTGRDNTASNRDMKNGDSTAPSRTTGSQSPGAPRTPPSRDTQSQQRGDLARAPVPSPPTGQHGGGGRQGRLRSANVGPLGDVSIVGPRDPSGLPIPPVSLGADDKRQPAAPKRRDSTVPIVSVAPDEGSVDRGIVTVDIPPDRSKNEKNTAPPTVVRNTGPRPNAEKSGRFPTRHVIRPNDSWWAIAERYWGAEFAPQYELIQAANSGVKMHPGKTVTVPAPPAKRPRQVSNNPATPNGRGVDAQTARDRSAPKRQGTFSHKVGEGETLWGLAQRFLGDGGRMHEIVQANPALKRRRNLHLRAGETVRIPRRTQR